MLSVGDEGGDPPRVSLGSMNLRQTLSYAKVDPITLQFSEDIDNRPLNVLIRIPDASANNLYFVVREWLGPRRAIIGTALDSRHARYLSLGEHLNDVPSTGTVEIVRAPILSRGAWSIFFTDGYLSPYEAALTLKLRISVFSDRGDMPLYSHGGHTSDTVHEYLSRLEGPQVAEIPQYPHTSLRDISRYPLSSTRGDLGVLPESDPELVHTAAGDKNTHATNEELREDRVSYLRQTSLPITLNQAQATSNRLGDISNGGTSRADLLSAYSASTLPHSESERFKSMLSRYVEETLTVTLDVYLTAI